MVEHIRQLGTPLISRLVDLPLDRGGKARSFGLDLAPLLREISGRDQPGTYLVGYRRIDQGSQRHYARIQVTDLSLTTLEEERAVASPSPPYAMPPVPGASVVVEGLYRDQWTNLIQAAPMNADSFATSTGKSSICRRAHARNQGRGCPGAGCRGAAPVSTTTLVRLRSPLVGLAGQQTRDSRRMADPRSLAAGTTGHPSRERCI